MFNGKIHDFDWAIFNSYVKLPEGILSNISGIMILRESPAKQQVFHGMTESFEHCSAVLFGYPYFDKKPHINIYHISVRNTHIYVYILYMHT